MATVMIDRYGTKEYRNGNNDIHRLDGPAVIWRDGEKHWVEDGHLSSSVRPSIYLLNGLYGWYIDDRWGRIDGPSSDGPNGFKRWLNDGKDMWPKLQ